MLIHPQLAALRHDDLPQRGAQQRLVSELARWQAGEVGTQLRADLDQFAKGERMERLPLLGAVFTAGDRAAATLVDSLIGWLTRTLEAEPLGHVPLRHHCDPTLATLILARAGSATLALQAIDGSGLARKPLPQSVGFPGNEVWDYVLAGTATAEIVTIAGQTVTHARLDRTEAALSQGMVAQRRGDRTVQLLRHVPGTLVTLKLQRPLQPAVVTREYALADGRLLHQAAANPRDSRFELAGALLGRMGRRDAAPVLAGLAQGNGSDHLRWQLLRECLGLDTAAGIVVLNALARAPNEPLAAPARRLQAELVARYPELAEHVACPA